ELRPALFAVRAFNIETALVAGQIRSREAVVGQIRFQWWRDAVRDAFEGRPPNHPVVLALAHTLHDAAPAAPHPADTAAPAAAPAEPADPGGSGGACDSSCSSTSSSGGGSAGLSSGGGAASRYSRYAFKRIIDCREADFLDPQPPLELSALEQYAEGTAAQLMYLQLSAVDVKNKDADHAASHLGRAVGITTLLRGTAAHAAARRSYLPLDLCAEARVSQEDVYGGVVSDGLRDVVHKAPLRLNTTAGAGCPPAAGVRAEALGPPCRRGFAAIPEPLRAAFGYCVQQVRQYDYLNYVWVAQMPK
ncbi:NADH dehydrogenase (ubiquinone) complex I, assembly factor 6, partial [Tetrabaena socialis]